MQAVSVMIIDDSETDRYILKRHLKSIGLGQELIEAEDGQIAIELFENFDKSCESHGSKFPPKIIFLDINMPILGGFEFLEQFEKLIESQKKLSPCLVMMFSSSDRPDDRDRALKKDFVREYIVKGDSDPEVLRLKIESALKST